MHELVANMHATQNVLVRANNAADKARKLRDAAIYAAIDSREIVQTEAAEMCDITQAAVSKIVIHQRALAELLEDSLKALASTGKRLNKLEAADEPNAEDASTLSELITNSLATAHSLGATPNQMVQASGLSLDFVLNTTEPEGDQVS